MDDAGRRPRVDYGSAAAVYERGRALADADLAAWQSAVLRLTASPVGTVLDLGAGTGIFSRAWVAWGADRVLACEPAARMRREAAARTPRRQVHMVGGRAEAIPLADDSSDVIWLSTVVHHLADPRAAWDEVGRVLRPGGWLLVRNMLADAGATGWLPHLPGAARARRIFPSEGQLASALASAGLQHVQTVEVLECQRNRSAGAAAAWIRMMREADSLLMAFSDAEIAAGLDNLDHLEATSSGLELGPSRIPLIAFRSSP